MTFKMWFSMSTMAKNKRDVDSEVKREQIEDAACMLFLVEGYESTSMASIAKTAGVAPNTLYWYFASKDDLLVAILDRLVIATVGTYVVEGLLSHPHGSQQVEKVVNWLTGGGKL